MDLGEPYFIQSHTLANLTYPATNTSILPCMIKYLPMNLTKACLRYGTVTWAFDSKYSQVWSRLSNPLTILIPVAILAHMVFSWWSSSSLMGILKRHLRLQGDSWGQRRTKQPRVMSVSITIGKWSAIIVNIHIDIYIHIYIYLFSHLCLLLFIYLNLLFNMYICPPTGN